MPNLSKKILTAVIAVTMAFAPVLSQAMSVSSGSARQSKIGIGTKAKTTGKTGTGFYVKSANIIKQYVKSKANTSTGGGVSLSDGGLQGMVSSSDGTGSSNTSVGVGTGGASGGAHENTSGGVSSGGSSGSGNAGSGKNSSTGVSITDAGYKGLPGQDNQDHTNTSTGTDTGSGSTDSNNDNTSTGVSTSSPDYHGLPNDGQDDDHTNTSTGVSTTDDGYQGLPGSNDDYDNGGHSHGESACRGHYYPKDIDGHWAEIYIRRLYDLCIIEGYSDGTFRPNHDVTRAELVKMSLYSKGIKANSGCYDNDCGSPFADLDRWQGQWIRPAWDRKIVKGYSHNQFKPNKAVTRAEAVKIILATYGYGPLNVGQSFFNDVNGWSVGWIEKAHEIGLVQGIGNGNFDPDRPITRAEAAKIISKMMEYWDTHIK